MTGEVGTTYEAQNIDTQERFAVKLIRRGADVS